MTTFSENITAFFDSLATEKDIQYIKRLEGLAVPSKYSMHDLLHSNYTLQLDLQNLNPEERQKVWQALTNNQTLTKTWLNPFTFRNNVDQFGAFHEEYKTSWFDFSGIFWSFCKQHWHKQAFHHPDNYYIFRSSKKPNLVMIQYYGTKYQTDNKFTPLKPKNVLSFQFFNKPINQINNEDTYAASAQDYHKKAIEKLILRKLHGSSSATLIALLIWFLVQYPPSTQFVLGLLASIGIPFFVYDIALLAIISLASIILSILINYIYTIMSPDVDIDFWKTFNMILYNLAFFVLPVIIFICLPAAALNVNLLIIAAIAALFAIYHFVCLNNLNRQEDKTTISFIESLFKSHAKPDQQHPSTNTDGISNTE